MSNIPDKFRYSLTMQKDEHHQGNTTKQKPSKRLVCLGVILCIILGFGIAWKIYYTKINQNVLSYEEDIWCYARMYEMEDYVTLVEAVMMQESRGKGIDVKPVSYTHLGSACKKSGGRQTMSGMRFNQSSAST